MPTRDPERPSGPGLDPGTSQSRLSWDRLGLVSAAPTSEGAQRSEAAWRLWERIRALDRRYALVVDSVLAGGLFLMCTGWLVLPHSNPDPGYVAGLTLPLVFRRRFPAAVFSVIAAVALLQWLTTAPMLADAALLAALYTVAVESNWTQVVLATLVLEIGVILATVRWSPVGNDLKAVVFLSGLAFAALLAGVVVRALRNQMGWLAERAQRLERERDQQASLAAAAERARIAREMHDVVSHNIQVMVTLADASSAARTRDPERSAEAVEEVARTGRQALTDMRRLLGVLRDDVHDVHGRVGDESPVLAREAPLAPQPGLAELAELTERVRGVGLPVSLSEIGAVFALSEAAELTVFRIIQEALTNVMKHAPSATQAVVTITFDQPDVTVRVSDDGGIASPAPSGGHGVAGMYERAAAFGGTLRAGPTPGAPLDVAGGWQVEAVLHNANANATANATANDVLTASPPTPSPSPV